MKESDLHLLIILINGLFLKKFFLKKPTKKAKQKKLMYPLLKSCFLFVL